MKNKILIVVLLISIFLIGFTIAYFNNDTNIENKFSTSPYSTTVIEHFIAPTNWKPGDTTSKTVYVSNYSLNNVAVRLSLKEEWISSNNTILTNYQDGQPIAIIKLSNNNDWIKDGDYYYYRKVLKPNTMTSSFMDSVTFNENIEYFVNCDQEVNIINCKYTIDDYENATYKLTIKVETVQFDFYKNAWDTTFEISNS